MVLFISFFFHWDIPKTEVVGEIVRQEFVRIASHLKSQALPTSPWCSVFPTLFT